MAAASSGMAVAQTATTKTTTTESTPDQSTTTTVQETPGQTTPGGQLVPGSQSTPGRQTTPGSEAAPGGGSGPVSAFPKAEFAPQEATIQRLTAEVHMTEEDTAPTRGFGGPTSIAIDPENPRHIVAASANLRTRVCHLPVSTDAGATWRFSEELPAPESYPFCTNNTAGVAQPSGAWGSDGTLYYAMQAYGEGEGTREGVTSIALARTTDLGETWTTSMVQDARSQPDPKPENTGVPGLAVNTSGAEDAVYVGFSRDWSATAEEGDPLEDRTEVAVAVSTDGGESFGEPVNLNDQSELTIEIGGQDYPLHFQTAFGALPDRP
ncbi:MAG: glycoside hydrolase [Actinomycetota bacterium]|nr:glycoside hydrolase [Actinomycetota bacterium]